MCVPITCVHRNANGVLSHVGGSTRDQVQWGLTIGEAVALIESRQYQFFVEVPAGDRTQVLVKTSQSGNKYLTTSPDGIRPNNLDSLPDLQGPLGSVVPAFPLNIPGTTTIELMSVTSLGYTDNNHITPIVGTPLNPIPDSGSRIWDGYTIQYLHPALAMWTVQPRLLYLTAIVPFVADHFVYENQSEPLEKVEGDEPGRRHALEAAGKGWWSMDFVLTRPDGTIDPSKPTRMTEARLIIRPSSHAWAQKTMIYGVESVSVNPYCPPSRSRVTFGLTQPAAPPPPAMPTTVVLPSVVGARLNDALATLYGVGVKYIVLVGPTAMTTDLIVESQSPQPGTQFKLATDTVDLTTKLAVAQPGVKTLRVTNESSSGDTMDIWLFDYTTGAWGQEASVANHGQQDVQLAAGHTVTIVAVDPSISTCESGRPDELDCVYQTTAATYTGDPNGLTIPWPIL